MIRYPAAQAAADKALRFEPRALKARYRRAIARKNMNLIPEALVDISSLLTTDPSNAEGKVEFQKLVDIHNKTGRRALSPEDILESDSPHAHGSLSNPQRENANDLHQMSLPFFRFGTPPSAPTSKDIGSVHGACHACRKPMHRKDLKTCKKVRPLFSLRK